MKNIEKLLEGNELKDLFEKDTKSGLFEIANYLIEKYNFKTFIGSNSQKDELYLFQDGIYSKEPAVMTIKKEVQDILGSLHTAHYTNEIIEKVKITTSEIGLTKENFAVSDVDLICIENGILNLKTRELIPHSPELPFLSKFPIEYKENTDCPKIKSFFSDIFSEEDILIIQEWIGYCLLRNYKYKKALLLESPFGAGKTQFLNVLQNFIGRQNVSTVSVQDLWQKFSTVSLYGKHVNAYDDLSFRDIKETGKFKMATGGGQIPASHKFQDEFHFSNFAKLIFATNSIPQITLDDDAYYSRWIIIQLPTLFRENAVPDIGNKISTKDELSGLLNFALDGLDRLEANEKFSCEQTMEEIKSIMQRSGSTLIQFIEERLKQSDEQITKTDFYNAYSDYCAEKKIWLMSKAKVGRELIKNNTYIKDGQDIIDGKNIRVWKNVGFKNEI